MKHSKRKHSSKERDTTADIIPMSNDPSLRGKSNNELDDYKNDSDDDYSNSGSSDDEYSNSDSSDDDDDYEDKRKSRKKKHDKSSREDSFEDEDEFTAPTIKSKKARPRRGGQFSNAPLSELKRERGVQQLHDKLNNNLHQIQIAIPYGQMDPQYVPPAYPDNTYLPMTPKPKTKWWKTRKFKYTISAVVLILVIVAFSVFVWKYLQAMKKINDHEMNILLEDENKRMNEEQENVNPLDEREYNKIGDNNYKPTNGGNKNNNYNNKSINGGNWKSKLTKILPPRDSRGRFMKRK